jgi:aminopeptidase YwaD
MKQYLPIHLVVICALSATAQTPTENIQATVEFLADDRLEGRATGSRGEEIAANYIANRFAAMNLEPAGENSGYFQVFDFSAGKVAGANNFIIHDGRQLAAQPVFLTGNAQLKSDVVAVGYGITAPELNYDDYNGVDVQGKIALIQLSTPEGTHPHTPYYAYADERIKVKLAAKNGALAVIFYNTDEQYDAAMLTDYLNKAESETIPVLLAEDATMAANLSGMKDVLISAELNAVRKTGKNVAGLLNNGAACTIVIGAHYDHLGYGESGGSLYRGEPAIHNGADDNASGVALILELADQLKKDRANSFNYLFIAFSGEELGLYGSKSIANFITETNECYNYMLNFDMVGRLDSNKSIIVNGFGTSPAWERMNELSKANGFTMKTYASGIGPSDHTSFYLKDIPVLHIFTGTHSDYHKPSDDANQVNYDGITEIMDLTRALIVDLDDEGKIAFTKTKEETNENAPRFTVTLGVIPDYTYEGKGMRLDGVSDGKPAANAGLKAGDVIVQLGDIEITDMMSYMKALSNFSKGDATSVTVMRGEERTVYPVQF